MTTPPLAGLKVLDFTHALAGPYATMLLAAYGAEVCKVEGVSTADMGRTWGPPFLNGESAYFLGLNSGKQGLALDLKHPRGRELALDLAAQADILIENLRPGAMTRNGLGYHEVSARHPGIIYCSISGYGQNGPARDEPAMDLILQAASGLLSVTGTPTGEQVRCGHSVADITAGMFGLIGILMALRTREQTGRGQWVDVAMFDGMISAMASNYAQYLGSGEIPRTMGTAFATIVPYACFPTADRPIALAVASESLWARFCTALNRPDWRADPRYATNALRVQHRDAFEPDLTAQLRTQPAAHWIAALNQAGVPCSLVYDMAEVADHPQSVFRQMFPAFHHPAAGPVRVTGMPVKFQGVPDQRQSAAPRHGEHSAGVLRDWLGLADAEIATLRTQRVVRQIATIQERPIPLTPQQLKELLRDSVANDYEDFEMVLHELRKWCQEDGLRLDENEILPALRECVLAGEIEVFDRPAKGWRRIDAAEAVNMDLTGPEIHFRLSREAVEELRRKWG